MRLYFVRHGQSEANILKVISNHGWKHPLTDLGREQTQALVERMRGEGITHIYSSPVMRAVQTAEILSQRLELTFTITEALRENDNGSLEGRSDADAWLQYERAITEWAYGLDTVKIADGENLQELRARFGAFIQGLVEEHRGKPSRMVLVGHGGLFRAGLPAVLERIDNAFSWAHPLRNTGMVTADEHDGKLWCIAWDGAELEWRKG